MGHYLSLVLPEATVPAMQALIDELASQLPGDRHAVLVMDRAGWDIAAKLTWPEPSRRCTCRPTAPNSI
ncbi:hypothetical protein [Sphingomonas sp. UYP23]